MKRFTATVKVDAKTRDVKEYDVQPKGEEGSMMSLSPKTLLIVAGISALVNVALFFGFRMVGLQSFFAKTLE